MFKRKEENMEDTMFARMIVVHSLIIQGLRDDHKHNKKGLQIPESDEGRAGEEDSLDDDVSATKAMIGAGSVSTACSGS